MRSLGWASAQRLLVTRFARTTPVARLVLADTEPHAVNDAVVGPHQVIYR